MSCMVVICIFSAGHAVHRFDPVTKMNRQFMSLPSPHALATPNPLLVISLKELVFSLHEDMTQNDSHTSFAGTSSCLYEEPTMNLFAYPETCEPDKGMGCRASSRR